MKKVLISTIALLFSLGAMAGETTPWTLRQCIDYAKANSITLKKQGLTRQSAGEDLLQARANLLPSLNFSSNQSVGYRPWVNDGISTVTNGMVSTSMKKSYYNGNYNLSASWTVWDGNKKRNNIKVAEVSEQKAALDSIAQANSIEEQIVQLYVQILYTADAIDVHRQSLASSKANEARGSEMVSLGKMSKADLAQLTAQRAQDEYNVVEAQSQLAKYKTQLKQLLEIPGDDTFDVAIPKTTDDQALAPVPSLMSVYEAALATRPEIAGEKLNIASSDLSIAVAKAGRLPSVSLNGSLGTSNTSMNDKAWGKQIKTNFDAMVGATISIPIFDNRSTKTAVSKARIQRLESELSLREKQKTLYSTIEGYWIDATTNQQKFKSAQQSLESQQTSYDLLSEQFRLGLKNIVELRTGKDNLLNAQQQLLQSKYMTILDQQLLRFYKGEAIEL